MEYNIKVNIFPGDDVEVLTVDGWLSAIVVSCRPKGITVNIPHPHSMDIDDMYAKMVYRNIKQVRIT